jgi:hypothetical protein
VVVVGGGESWWWWWWSVSRGSGASNRKRTRGVSGINEGELVIIVVVDVVIVISITNHES